MRADKTKYFAQCKQLTLLSLLIGTLCGCQSAGSSPDRVAGGRTGDAAAEAYVASAVQPPQVTQVAFDTLVSEAEQMMIPAMDQGLGSQPEIGADAVLPTAAPFDLAEAESLAIAGHPAISEARARVESVRGQYVQAGLPPNPTLQYQSDEIGNEDSSGLHSLSVSQQYVTGNKLAISQQVQAQEMQKQQAQLKVAELRVLTAVRAAFAQALVSQRRVELTSQIVNLAEQSIVSVESLLAAEEVSRVALLQARVEAEQVRITAENAVTQYQANRLALAAAIGYDTVSFGPLVGDIAEGLVDSPWDQLLYEITTTSPEMTAAGSELERARWALQLACSQNIPNVTGQVGVGVDTATDDTFASISVSMPLPIRNRNQGNVRSARANITEAAVAIDRTRLSLQGRLATVVGRYQTAHQTYQRIKDNVLPDAEETYRLSQTAFDAGETSFLQLLTAQRTLFDTRLSVLESAAQARQAIAELNGLLVGTLDSPNGQ